MATVLSFLPGENWGNFVGFFITLAVISVILHFVVLLPRKLIQKIWKRGLLFRLLGGALNTFNASIGMVVFALVLLTYPVFDWLERAVAGSSVVSALVQALGFVQALLPTVFRDVADLMVSGPLF